MIVPHNGRLFPRQALTVACWVRSEQPGQNNNWIVNSVFGHGATGYRLGVLHGPGNIPDTFRRPSNRGGFFYALPKKATQPILPTLRLSF